MVDATSFPNFKGKHAHDAFFGPQEYVGYLRQHNLLPDLVVPDGVIFSYQSSVLRHILETQDVRRVDLFAGEFYLLSGVDERIGISGRFGIGAPAVTTVLEGMIALGVRRFASIGTAGALSKALRIGDVVVCERAIRDEGVSHHYLEPAKYAHASPALTDRLDQTLRALGITPVRGTTWTIDTPYRETVEEARLYQQEGVLTVEMEAAALFTVAQYRGVDVASAVTISDSLADLVWDPQFHAGDTKAGLETLFQAAVQTLLSDSAG